MKKVIAIVLLAAWMAVMPPALAAQSGRIFGSFADKPGVESVYIGKAGLRFAGKAAFMERGDLGDVCAGITDMESIEILNCEKKALIPELQQQAQALVDSMKLELIVEARDGGDEATRIYGIVPEDNPAVLKSLLIEARDGNEYSLIYIRGTVDIEALENYGSEK